MKNKYPFAEKRVQKRYEIDPFDMKYCLEFTLGGKRYECSALDRSPNGVAMLVLDKDTEIIDKLKVGEQIEMNYTTPEGKQSVWLQVKHISSVEIGILGRHYQIGLSPI